MYTLAIRLESPRSGAWEHGLWPVMGRILEPNLVWGETADKYLHRFMGLNPSKFQSNNFAEWVFGHIPLAFRRDRRVEMLELAYRIFFLLSEYDIPARWSCNWSDKDSPFIRFCHQSYGYLSVRASAVSYVGVMKDQCLTPGVRGGDYGRLA